MEPWSHWWQTGMLTITPSLPVSRSQYFEIFYTPEMSILGACFWKWKISKISTGKWFSTKKTHTHAQHHKNIAREFPSREFHEFPDTTHILAFCDQSHMTQVLTVCVTVAIHPTHSTEHCPTFPIKRVSWVSWHYSHPGILWPVSYDTSSCSVCYGNNTPCTPIAHCE